MQLTYTAKQKAFRAEVRAWLQANVPSQPLASYDTREGFEEHRAWEGKLYESRLSMVMWPEHLGGSRLRPDRMVDLRGRVLRRWSAHAGQPEWPAATRADPDGVRQ